MQYVGTYRTSVVNELDTSRSEKKIYLFVSNIIQSNVSQSELQNKQARQKTQPKSSITHRSISQTYRFNGRNVTYQFR